MRTINPLFLDSTKPIGDKVVTNVELLQVLLHDGDTLFFEMSDEFGFVQRFSMKRIETKKSIKYVSEVWLKYQHQIRYRFLIVFAGEEIFTTKIRNTPAGHIISDKWEPCFEKTAEPTKKEKIKTPRTPREVKPSSTKPLANPPLFDQIRSLINELM